MDETGINRVTLASGEIRYQVVTKTQEHYAYLGWYSTPEQAEKALRNALK